MAKSAKYCKGSGTCLAAGERRPESGRRCCNRTRAIDRSNRAASCWWALRGSNPRPSPC